MRSAKIQIRLRIRAVCSESSLGLFWVAKDANVHLADIEDRSDWVDAQVDLSLHWAHMSDGTKFSRCGLNREYLISAD